MSRFQDHPDGDGQAGSMVVTQPAERPEIAMP
jgi:hypothetical protein